VNLRWNLGCDSPLESPLESVKMEGISPVVFSSKRELIAGATVTMAEHVISPASGDAR
jgi:hypothetical protein